MLVTNDVTRDARVRKEAQSAVDAGGRVIVIGTGDGDASAFADSSFEVRLVTPMTASTHPFWPVRVVANLLATVRFRKQMSDAAIAVRADLYHANDLDTLAQGMRAAARTGAALVYDAHELSTEAGTMKAWQRAAGRRLERSGIRRADGAVCVNGGIARELARRYRVDEPTVVYNGGSTRVTAPSPVGRPVRLLFQGQFFADRGIDALIRVVASRRGDVVLTLQGWGGIEQELRGLVAQLDAGRVVRFAAPCDPLSVVECAADHDIGVINHLPLSLNHTLASPNKLFDYICAGLAVVAPDYPVFREILTDAGCGVLARSASAEDMADALAALLESAERIGELKAAAVASSERYLWATQAERLIAVYRTALARRAAR